MNRPTTRILILLLLAAGAFSLATMLQPRAAGWGGRSNAAGVLEILLGDARRLFANHFFVKADISFHSGYYPTIFDQTQAPQDSRHMTEEEGGQHDSTEEEHEKAMNFLGPPRDFIERFGRNFMVTKHSHLTGGNEREILPWLRLSAELDPQRVATYTVAAYWLRRRLGKPREAEQFLREGLRANPNSFEILFELGRLYHEDFHDDTRARNVWELAWQRWREQEGGKQKANLLVREEIAVNMARLEEGQGNIAAAIGYLELAKESSPSSAVLQQQIYELKKKIPSRNAPEGRTP